jgi:hypothetical protein
MLSKRSASWERPPTTHWSGECWAWAGQGSDYCAVWPAYLSLQQDHQLAVEERQLGLEPRPSGLTIRVLQFHPLPRDLLPFQEQRSLAGPLYLPGSGAKRDQSSSQGSPDCCCSPRVSPVHHQRTKYMVN